MCSIRIQVEVNRRRPNQFLPRITEALAGLLVHINNRPLLEVEDEEGVRRVVHKRAEARLAVAQRFFSPLARGPGTQSDDAKRQVAGQFLQQPSLFRRKSIGLCGINVKTAEGVGLFVLERQADGGTKTALQSEPGPCHVSGLRGVILNAGSFPGSDGRSARAAPTLGVGPSNAEVCERLLLGSGQR